jgi:hypothetical protein
LTVDGSLTKHRVPEKCRQFLPSPPQQPIVLQHCFESRKLHLRRLLLRIHQTMSLAISRSVLRQSTKLPARVTRRFESTTAKASEAAKNTASKASETASDYKSKASEGLSKVASSAGPAIAGAAQGVGNALGRIGGRTGKLVAFIEREDTPPPHLGGNQ